MALKKLQVGERVPAADYNALVDAFNKPTVQTPIETTNVSPLYGVSNAAFGVYSVFGIYPGETQPDIDTPVVKIAPIGSSGTSLGAPFGLVTNGEYDAVSGERTPIELLSHGLIRKFDVGSSDSGFVVGQHCGPMANSAQLSSAGVGFICLTPPATYQTSKKFIWAALHPAPILLARTTANIADGSTTMQTATVNLVNIETGYTNDTTKVVNHFGPAVTHGSGKLLLLAPVFGVGYCTVVGGSDPDLSPYVRDIRLNGLKFQLTRNGTTWIDWTEGYDCGGGVGGP